MLHKHMADKRIIPASRFVSTWGASSSLKEVANALGISSGYASVRASVLRAQGEPLKHMTRPKANRNDRRVMTRTDTGKKLMTRASESEYDAWSASAEKEGLTLGPWSRMHLNRAARKLKIADKGGEYNTWAAAAALEGISIGQWSRVVLNKAARALGVQGS